MQLSIERYNRIISRFSYIYGMFGQPNIRECKIGVVQKCMKPIKFDSLRERRALTSKVG